MSAASAARPSFEPRCLATAIGSLPHTDVARGVEQALRHTPEIPAWPQLPKRDFRENMMLQFTEGMPALMRGDDRVYFDTASRDYTDQLGDFYQRYLAATEQADGRALDSFGLSREFAAGFQPFVERLPGLRPLMVKGQVTGPFTLGVNLLDQNRRCAYYDDQLRDVVVKTVTMKARWQVSRLSRHAPAVMIFLDEPSLLGYGSQTFITVSRDDVLHDLNEVVADIHALGALAGVHCEADTDWSLLMASRLDVLDFDAYDHLQAMTLYPAELKAFLERGGSLGWGIVPTLDPRAAERETADSLQKRFEEGLKLFERKGLDRELLLRRALLTPSCGAGGVLSVELAERVLGLLSELSATLRKRYKLE
jgi:methionine synthase II (cobalamin-independent)